MTTNSSGPAPPETFDYEEYQHHLDLVRTYGPTALFMDRVIRCHSTHLVAVTRSTQTVIGTLMLTVNGMIHISA